MTKESLMLMFWAWLGVAIAFGSFILGTVVGYRRGWRDAKSLFKGSWE